MCSGVVVNQEVPRLFVAEDICVFGGAKPCAKQVPAPVVAAAAGKEIPGGSNRDCGRDNRPGFERRCLERGQGLAGAAAGHHRAGFLP